MKEKIALFCDIHPDAVIPNQDVDTIYEVPLCLEAAGLDEILLPVWVYGMVKETLPSGGSLWKD